MQTKEELELERSLLACDCERESKYKNDISALYFIKALRFNFDPSFEELIKKTRPDIAKKYFCPHFRVTSKEQAQEFIKKSHALFWESLKNDRNKSSDRK